MGADANERARLERTFFRLLTQCDDDGRIRDDRRLLKGLLYPVHEEVTSDSLDLEMWGLADAGLIDRYSTPEGNFIQVVSWSEYQHPQRPTASKLPPITSHGAEMRTRVQLAEDSRTTPPRLMEHSSPEGRGGEGKGDGEEMERRASARE
jgi:hypothetical protein